MGWQVAGALPKERWFVPDSRGVASTPREFIMHEKSDFC